MIIYSGATILGDITVGRDCVIGATPGLLSACPLTL
ncbi:hypothetical protein LWM68_38925 [Niabella sp. W65]|nr:hypothetical protein [Niabella sp. W65]MCH7368186.1 hypothetical protein [Niabella sp. W65]ULT43797.1 hypothetical protein KRR40_10585 [Niabella sp. I65]